MSLADILRKTAMVVGDGGRSGRASRPTLPCW
jgi:hypothetical protein